MSQPPFQPYGGSPNPGQPGYPPAQPGTYPPPPPPPPGYPPAQPAGYPPPPQPTYQPAGQPGYPPAPPPPAPPTYPVGPTSPAPAAPGNKMVGKIIGIVAVLLLAGIGAVAYFALKGSSIRVQTPTSLLGKAQTTNAEIVSSMNEAKASLNESVEDITSSVAAAYGELESNDLIMVVAASGKVGNADKELDSALTSFAEGFGGSLSASSVDPGPLGGSAKCADFSISGTSLATCAWADSGSVGVVLFYFKKAADVKADFVTARGQIEMQ